MFTVKNKMKCMLVDSLFVGLVSMSRMVFCRILYE